MACSLRLVAAFAPSPSNSGWGRAAPGGDKLLLRKSFKKIGRSPIIGTVLGSLLAYYLRLVRATTRFTFEPDDPYGRAASDLPAIVTAWHGEHLLPPLFRRPDHGMSVLVSRSADGEINAVAARKIGLSVIRGSGGRDRRRTIEKGGISGLKGMVSALASGDSVAQTADVSHAGYRHCGKGIIVLAKLSGRPIIPVAAATRHFLKVASWDRATVPLPFGRGAFVAARALYVPGDADDDELEHLRKKVEALLNDVQARAETLAGRASASDIEGGDGRAP